MWERLRGKPIAGQFLRNAFGHHVVLQAMNAADVARLIDAYAGPLVLYARQWCGTPEDVVQEAFMKFVRQKRPPEDAVAWLYRVVRNGALDAAKIARRRQRPRVGGRPAGPLVCRAGS